MRNSVCKAAPFDELIDFAHVTVQNVARDAIICLQPHLLSDDPRLRSDWEDYIGLLKDLLEEAEAAYAVVRMRSIRA